MIFHKIFNGSPFFLTLIFITFFDNVHSRHRIRHYQERFKRQQGEHLYLPGSFVAEGGSNPHGPDEGPWQEWSSPSACSRTCGGGVSSQQRECTPGYHCNGPTMRHFSCNTQDCPSNSDFRAEQCSQYDSVLFENIYHTWIPYTKGDNPCALLCMPRGERFYYRHQPAVVDGTRCNEDSFDVCVNGQCQPVGCDRMLGSNAKEDSCRVCEGNQSTCNILRGTLDMQDLSAGYNDILLIPAGATNIVIQDAASSLNYLAIRNSSGHYYLNGDYRIDFPRTIEFAGCRFHYDRDLLSSTTGSTEKISCLGPTDEALFIAMLHLGPNMGVKYEYSVPNNIHLSSESESYAWIFNNFGECSKTCGGGEQSRNVTCAGRKTLKEADVSLCDLNSKPDSVRKCAEIPCEAQWVPHPWGNCSSPCGEEGGTQVRQVSCQQVVSNGYASLVQDDQCMHLPKPPQEQRCNQGRICAKWHIGPWKPCDHLCGEGKQSRKVKCFIMDDKNKIKVLPDSDCEAIQEKPDMEKTCNLRPCEGVDWITSEWSGCTQICGLTNETRKVQCATAKGEIYPEELCDKERKPKSIQECDASNVVCQYLWYSSQWSDCSVDCGEGVQTRKVFCGSITPDGVKEVDNSKCDTSKHFELIKNCTGEKDSCEGEWFSGPWDECSKPCGGGERSKKVVCLQNSKVVDPSKCDSNKIIFSREECNKGACSADTIMPTDITQHVDESESTTIAIKLTTSKAKESTQEEEVTETSETDKVFTTTPKTDKAKPEDKEDDSDYEIVPDEECEDGEWVDSDDYDDFVDVTKAQGDDNFVSSMSTTDVESSFSTDDLMMSDATASTIEGTESTLLTDLGSGDSETPEGTEPAVSTLSSSDSTVEGSGAASTFTDSSDASEEPTESLSNSFDAPIIPFQEGSESPSTDISPTESFDLSTTSDSSISSTLMDELSTTLSSSEQTEQSTTSDNEETTTIESSTFETTETPTETTIVDLSTTETIDLATTDSSETTLITTTDSNESTTTEQSSESTPQPSEFSSTTEVSGTTQEGTTDLSSESSSSSSATEESATSESSTLGITKSTIDFTGTTEVAATGSTLSSSDSSEVTEITSETPTEVSGSTETSSESVSTESETSSATKEFDVWSSVTETSTDTSDQSTVSELWETTPVTEIFTRKRMCKRRKLKSCKKTKYGCCWDNISAVKGPFGKGCPTPKTCKESVFGCCEDGVSQALGPKNKGCPETHCSETLFGCCPDKKTPSEGNDNEGCPPPPPACLKSKYGCCKDKKTPAKGPKGKGCEPKKPTKPKIECSNSTFGCCPDGTSVAEGEYFKGCDIFKDNCTESYFGCCPDGKSSAQGPTYIGCEVQCALTVFGCCPDGITPAHGYNSEGCCLTSPYGCCPDNIIAANGPQLEGCGCRYSPYGCCPDNITPAQGHQNEGCPCQYTQHGCCPDNEATAQGPDYQGCPCHTFQFGCCPDGVTSAQGPNEQGCGCRSSEFGCCSDDETLATGPEEAGCGCESTKFGCCPDGATKSQGENFEGCSDVPANLQESCSLPKERGSCRNYTVKWFYDMDYGGCSRFWYGGCDGNPNRFRSREECEGVCLRPEGADKCKLPKVPGPCKGYYLNWYYDKESKNCGQFVYGGCLGNDNRFETREECAQLCVTDTGKETCEQPKAEGPCRGQYRRFYFDKEAGGCRDFVFGGCKGNDNNFPTMEACRQRCATPGKKRDHCTLPLSMGNCTGQEAKWYFKSNEDRCLPFYYTGCNGNNNNFATKEDCDRDCPKEVVKDTCHLPAETGECANYVEKWFFDTKLKTCRRFYYGGCGGNGNNFGTEQECLSSCQEAPPTPPTRPEPPRDFRQEYCYYPSDSGSCQNMSTRFFYDTSDGICKPFAFGGCEGNSNNFGSEQDCIQNCGNVQDPCSLPASPRPCYNDQPDHYYDLRTDSCSSYNQNECGRNTNRFSSKESCEQSCRRSQVVVTQAPVEQRYRPSSNELCQENADPGTCQEPQSAYFYNTTSGQCTPFTYSGCGGNNNRFNSEEQCQRYCGSFRDQDVCNVNVDPGPCKGYFIKYFFDRASSSCRQFVYGGCDGSSNRFSSSEECESLCLAHQENKPRISNTVVCKMPVQMGNCVGNSYKRWYFDDSLGLCNVFIYSGCGGNFNNFKSYSACTNYCQDLTNRSPENEPNRNIEPHPCEEAFSKCATISCPYGIEAYVDQNQCNTCQCVDPCRNVNCPQDQQCAIDLNTNRTSEQDPNFIAICRETNKPGSCPSNLRPQECSRECNSDADCSGILKCCSITNCGTVCAEPAGTMPAELITQSPQAAYTQPPLESGYLAPEIDPVIYKPEVQALIGDQVILNCAVKGNPNPKITWQKDNLLIDGTQARYRVKLDQTLQILTLHKTDAGIYLCTANNNLGVPIQNKIRLDVLDSEPRPATVYDDETQKTSVVSLNAPATLNCYALGHPLPSISWWKDDNVLPTNNEYIFNGYSLLIHSVQLHNLGIYTCQAYNGEGKAASWSVTVKAKGPYYSTNPEDNKYLQYIVNPPEESVTARPQYPYRPQQYDPTPANPYIPIGHEVVDRYDLNPDHLGPVRPGSYVVPVQTNITISSSNFAVGSTISLPCDVQGFPIPQVQWYKDGVTIYPSERIMISESHRLTLQQATTSDSGVYQCEANNGYSQHASSVTIQVQDTYINPTCTDSPYLANCRLIVKANACSHKYYAKFCCRSCTEAGLLPVQYNQDALQNNLV